MRINQLLTASALAMAAMAASAAPASAALTFTPTDVATTASSSTTAVAGDFNGDGTPDVASLVGTAELKIRYGVPGSVGSFVDGETHTSSTRSYSRIIAADLNGDGIDDIALLGSSVANPANGLAVYSLGSATGVPAPTGYGLIGMFPSDFTAFNLDGSGRKALAITGRTNTNFSDGKETSFLYILDLFPVSGVIYRLTPPASPMPIVTDDFNRDGHADIAYAGNGGVTVRYGSGLGNAPVNGGYMPFLSSYRTFAGVGAATSLATGDVDGDGRPDLITKSGGALRVWRSPEPGMPGATEMASVPASTGNALVMADFDRDDHVDAISGDDNGHLRLHRGRGDGTFEPEVDLGGAPSGVGPVSSLVTSDLDANGRVDVLASSPNRISRFMNDLPAAPARAALISEVRFSGPNGAADQYVQIYNPGTTPLSLGGWKLRAVGLTVAIPEGTVVPAAGHVLITRPTTANTGYSLAASGRASILAPSLGSGVALVDPTGVTRDAVGLTGAPSGYVSGTPLAPFTAIGQSGFVRKFSGGKPVNTGNNAADFVALDTKADGTGSTILGAPRPDSFASPTMKNDFLQSSLVDASKTASEAPNRVLVAATAADKATVTINRRITNCSGPAKAAKSACANAATVPAVTVTKLRFRVTALTTVGSPAGTAQLKVVPSSTGLSGGAAVSGLPLDAPSEPSGGGLNSTLTATQLIPAGGFKPGDQIDVSFKFVVERSGAYTFAFNTEDDLVEGDAPLPTPTPAPVAEPLAIAETMSPLRLDDAAGTPPAPAPATPAPSADQPAPGPVVPVATPAAQASVVDTATETTRGVIPASAVAAAPVRGSVAAPASAKPAAPTTKAKAKKATCKAAKTAKAKSGKAKAKSSTKPCTTKTTKAKAKSSAKAKSRSSKATAKK